MKFLQPTTLLGMSTLVAGQNITEANNCSTFHVGNKDLVASQYNHHGNITALWYDLLKPRFGRGPAYPINYGANVSDFEPIFETLIHRNVSDAFDERWPQEFIPTLNRLVEEANAQRGRNNTLAEALYWRVNALGHIAHYPSLHTPLRYGIYETQIAAFLNATSFWETPYSNIQIPHTHGIDGEGASIPTFYRPAPRNATDPVPVLVRLAGVDGFRSDQPHNVEQAAYEAGYAYLIAEIPGTGASPALPRDSESPDRLWSSIIDWIEQQPGLNSKGIIFWGVSTGGYYGFRVAYTHRDRILGAIGNGGWSNCVITRTWMDIADVGEYPTSLSRTFAWKFGYDPVSPGVSYNTSSNASYANFLDDLPALKAAFSLVDNGLADEDSAPLLLVDGTEDTIFAVEDSEILLNYGKPKYARFVPGAHHPGEPGATPIILEWIAGLLRR